MKTTTGAAWTIQFYTTPAGDSPVVEFLERLPKNERSKAYHHLKLLESLGTQIGMPQARPLKGHKPLWELRPMPNRLIYAAFSGGRFIVVHAFTKKQDKTPPNEIEIAEKRLAELLERMAEDNG